MNISLTVLQLGAVDWLFRVTFENDTKVPVMLPVETIKRKGERLGLRLQLEGVDIEPVDFTLVSPRSLPVETQITPNGKVVIDFPGKIEQKAHGVYALLFENAAYKIFPGMGYTIRFVWHDIQSNSVEWLAGKRN